MFLLTMYKEKPGSLIIYKASTQNNQQYSDKDEKVCPNLKAHPRKIKNLTDLLP